jgi:integrase
MPKVARELSALEVRRLKRRGWHAVGGVSGLHLRISETGARYWVLRTTIGGKRRDIGIGPFPEVSLADARAEAAQIRRDARKGKDPVAERKAARDALRAAQAKALTFDQCARRYLAGKASEFRSPKHAKQWKSTLEAYASPVIGTLPVDQVELAHLLQILEPIWREKTETATRLRGRIEKVLDYATVSGYRSGENPARWKGNLDAVLPKPGKVTKVRNHRALPIDELGAFMRALRKREGMAARALEFVILTATRSGEVRGATWDEINLEGKVWTIPAERMKAGKEHRVPLTDDAVKLLEELPRFESNELVFPAPRGGKLSDMALAAVMKRMQVNAVPHGFRSTFRDWCAERTNYPHAVAEMALAHAIGNKVEAAYRRGDLFEKRSRLMADWARFCRTVHKAGEVVAIREAK